MRTSGQRDSCSEHFAQLTDKADDYLNLLPRRLFTGADDASSSRELAPAVQ